MESLSSKNKNVKCLLCVIDVATKFAWVKPLKDKKRKTFPKAFIEIVNESNRKSNKSWADQGRWFYNKIMQESLKNNDLLMYCARNESKSVIAEKFIKTNSKLKPIKQWQLVIEIFIFCICIHY